MALVDKGDGNSFRKVRKVGHPDPSLQPLSHDQLQLRIQEDVRKAGACLMCLTISTTSEILPPTPRGLVFDQRLYQYPPFKSPLGRNILRVWKSRQSLWKAAKINEQRLGSKYSMAIWTRDDAFWINRIVDPAELLKNPNSPRTVWSKGCKQWSGINDKTVLLGRDAAEDMLSVYSSFWKKEPSLRSFNAEVYLKVFANSRKLILKELPFDELPNSDAMLYGENKICLLKHYWCPHPSPWNTKLCEDMFPAMAGGP